MLKNFIRLTAFISVFQFTGCTDRVKLIPNNQIEITVLGFNASKGSIKYANVGDSLFVSGKVAMHECIILTEDVLNRVIPHGLTRFEISIKASALLPAFESAERYLYVANNENYTSDFLRYGPRFNKCGISIDKKTKQKYWFMHSLSFPTLFEDPLTLTETNLIKFKSIPIENDAATAYKEVIFNGFYNNLFHFTLIEKTGTSIENKEFKFNPSEDSTTTVSFKGLLLKIHGVDNLGIMYEWINAKESINDEEEIVEIGGV